MWSQGLIALVPGDLKNAADFAEIMLAMHVRKHQCDVLRMVGEYVDGRGPLWP
jgi:hypothetical protein